MDTTTVELDVTESKLLELILQINDARGDGLSAKELRQFTGIGRDKLRVILGILIEQGLVRCHIGQRKYVDGRIGFTPVYALTTKGLAYESTR